MGFRFLIPSKKRSKPSSPLPADLPPIYRLSQDLILYLLESLPPPDAAAFALTSQAVWRALGGLPDFRKLVSQIDQGERRAFLSRLEQYYPNHVYCSQCIIFHKQDKKRYVCRPHPFGNEIFGDLTVRDVRFERLDIHVPFLKAKEIMNRHRYGEPHGCLPTVMDFNCRIRCLNFKHKEEYSDPPRYFSLTARSAHDKLLLRADVSVFIRPKDFEVNKSSVIVSSLYDSTHMQRPGGAWKSLLESFAGSNESTLFVRCSSCLAEMRCIVNTQKNQKYYEIRNTTWHNLGPCRDSFDRKWRTETEHCCDDSSNAISPAESFYLAHFDDKASSQLKIKQPPCWLSLYPKLCES
ncbi:predicted protein [Uncinocarpus reesii 1704]|uniref:Uncharacterized protein n=1 Tax=Uncinocarpus reesii (strain UAMH 1704) TaxID=336963 RepID=C4JF07_UNCRE|nr:uncharacterized protein UREG_00908 [Uncinocarpus reesii 1704]EEP76060.1 predicted protein [Uncinocarpus reesii 1704]